MAKVVVSVQVKPEQRDKLADLAAADDRTLSYVVRRALSQYLEHAEPPPRARAVSSRGHDGEAARR